MSLIDSLPKLKTCDLGILYRPFKFAAFDLDYKFRNFTQYKIAEHDLLLTAVLIFDYYKYFNIEVQTGFALRFVDVNIYNDNTVYKKDWLFNASFKFKINFLFHPCFLYSGGFSIGNIPEHDIYSLNYWQLEFLNYFHLPDDFTVFFNGGFGYAGSLPFAGIINKIWVRIGAVYEIKAF